MEDKEFNKIWNALHDLKDKGALVVVLDKNKEAEMRKAFEERYKDVPQQLSLRGVDLMFV